MAMADACKKNPMKGIPLETDFRTFFLSLFSSGLVHLGETPDPTTGQIKLNPALAKQTIDIVALLKQKFEQGLTEDERKLLCEGLYRLRMTYVNKVK